MGDIFAGFGYMVLVVCGDGSRGWKNHKGVRAMRRHVLGHLPG